MKFGNIEISAEEFNALSEEKIKFLLKAKVAKAKPAREKKAARFSFNGGAALEVEPQELTEKDGCVFFAAEGFDVGRKSGYPVVELKEAARSLEAGIFQRTHAKTGLRGVEIGNGVIFENLVVHAKRKLPQLFD